MAARAVNSYSRSCAVLLILWLACAHSKPNVQDQFVKAVSKGQLKKVRELLDRGAMADHQDMGKGVGKTPIMRAVEKGHGKVASALIKVGVMLERRDKEGWSALMHALDKRQFDMARLLLKAAKKQGKLQKILDTVSKSGTTPLFVLAASLEDGGLDKDGRKLFEQMVKGGAGCGGDNRGGKGGFIVQGLIQKLAQKGDAKLVRLVLKNGANADETDETGVTPLMTGAVFGHDAVVRALVDEGADLLLRDEYGKTALHQCSLFCSTETIEMLVGKMSPAALGAKDKDGVTAWDMASSAKRSDAVLRLLRVAGTGAGQSKGKGKGEL